MTTGYFMQVASEGSLHCRCQSSRFQSPQLYIVNVELLKYPSLVILHLEG